MTLVKSQDPSAKLDRVVRRLVVHCGLRVDGLPASEHAARAEGRHFQPRVSAGATAARAIAVDHGLERTHRTDRTRPPRKPAFAAPRPEGARRDRAARLGSRRHRRRSRGTGGQRRVDLLRVRRRRHQADLPRPRGVLRLRDHVHAAREVGTPTTDSRSVDCAPATSPVDRAACSPTQRFS